MFKSIGVFVVNFEHFTYYFGMSFVDFEQIDTAWFTATRRDCFLKFFVHYEFYSKSYKVFKRSLGRSRLSGWKKGNARQVLHYIRLKCTLNVIVRLGIESWLTSS